MKLSWIFWWIVNVCWLILFAVGTFFIWTREVDGAGAVQTPKIKLASFLVLLFAFLFPLTIQFAWFIINKIVSKNKKAQIE